LADTRSRYNPSRGQPDIEASVEIDGPLQEPEIIRDFRELE